MCGHATYPRARVNKNRVGAHVNPLSGAWAPCPRSTSRAQLCISGLTPPPQGPRCGTSSNPSRHRRRQPPLHFACNSSASHSTAPQKPRNTNALDSDPEIPTGELHAKLGGRRTTCQDTVATSVEETGGTGGPGCGVRGRWGAWSRCRWVAAGPGRASRSTTPSLQARVWRSRGRAAAHRHTQRPGTIKQRGARTTGARANRPYSPPPPGSGRPV